MDGFLPCFDDQLDGALKCPNCGGGWLHHGATRAFYRSQEDSEEGTYAYCNTARVVVGKSMEGNPSGRRDGLSIEFECETCPAQSRLRIIQHKGSTYMDWEITSLKADHPLDS